MTLTHPRSTSRRLATVILLALLGTLAAALTAGAAYADGTVVTGNQNCVDLIPGSEELRVQSPADGTFVGVAVKGGPDANFYDYRPDGVSSGTGLHAPVNPRNQKFFGLSHISFCYMLPTTTPTPSPTPTPTPSTPSSPGTPSGGGGGTELPTTGLAVGAIAALGVALVGGGFGLMLVRRRRDKFVA